MWVPTGPLASIKVSLYELEKGNTSVGRKRSPLWADLAPWQHSSLSRAGLDGHRHLLLGQAPLSVKWTNFTSI